MNIIVTLHLTNRNPTEIVNSARIVCQGLKNSAYCSSFTLTNRSKEGKVDCYFFDFTYSIAELQQQFSMFNVNQNDIQEFPITPDHLLVKFAGMTTEVLLSQYSTEEIHEKLVTEHMHYILNGLGDGYKKEIIFYLNAAYLIVNNVIP